MLYDLLKCSTSHQLTLLVSRIKVLGKINFKVLSSFEILGSHSSLPHRLHVHLHGTDEVKTASKSNSTHWIRGQCWAHLSGNRQMELWVSHVASQHQNSTCQGPSVMRWLTERSLGIWLCVDLSMLYDLFHILWKYSCLMRCRSSAKTGMRKL